MHSDKYKHGYGIGLLNREIALEITELIENEHDCALYPKRPRASVNKTITLCVVYR